MKSGTIHLGGKAYFSNFDFSSKLEILHQYSSVQNGTSINWYSWRWQDFHSNLYTYCILPQKCAIASSSWQGMFANLEVALPSSIVLHWSTLNWHGSVATRCGAFHQNILWVYLCLKKKVANRFLGPRIITNNGSSGAKFSGGAYLSRKRPQIYVA